MNRARLILTQAVDCRGKRYALELWTTTSRPAGRRIVVKDGRETVFDTGDCFDLANAHNKLDLWAADLLRCAQCGEDVAPEELDDCAQDQNSGAPICAECVQDAAQFAELVPAEHLAECPI